MIRFLSKLRKQIRSSWKSTTAPRVRRVSTDSKTGPVPRSKVWMVKWPGLESAVTCSVVVLQQVLYPYWNSQNQKRADCWGQHESHDHVGIFASSHPEWPQVHVQMPGFWWHPHLPQPARQRWPQTCSFGCPPR